MQITKNKVATLEYTLRNDSQVLDSSENHGPMLYLHGAGMIIPGLEQALEGRAAGDQFRVVLPPEQAWGPKDPNKIVGVNRKHFGGAAEIKPGMKFRAGDDHGGPVVTVIEVEGDTVKLDANHPFAGLTVTCDVKVVDVRDARQEELEHGHACYGDHSCEHRHAHMK